MLTKNELLNNLERENETIGLNRSELKYFHDTFILDKKIK